MTRGRDPKPEKTALQERLRAHALRRVRSERAQRLGPIFAAFSETSGRFRYTLDTPAERALSAAVGALHARYCSSNRFLASARSADSTFETQHRTLTRLATDNGLAGETDLWFEAYLNDAAHVDADDLHPGVFRAELSDMIRATAHILSCDTNTLPRSMALVAADRGWMIHIEDGGYAFTATAPL